MSVQRIALNVLEASDLEKSLHFYRDLLGLPLKMGNNMAGDDRWLAGDHAEMSWTDKGYFHFALYQAKEKPTTGFQLGFLLTDIAGVHNKLAESGVVVIHPPRKEPWGQTSRYYDPDNNVVSLTELSRR
jgi:lactoylglutathione lyase